MSHRSPHTHAHGEVAVAANFDALWYQESPRSGLVAMSGFGRILNHSGGYNSLGSPDAEIELNPMTGDIVGFVFELWGNTAGTAKAKFYALQGAARAQLGTEVTTTGTSDPNHPAHRMLANLNSVGVLGDLRGEAFTLEVYFEHTAGATRARHLRVYGGTETYASVFLR